MQRALVAIAMALLLAAPPVLAQSQLRAALAPVQTAVDAAASVVTLAMTEADRDGTPDEATRLRDALLAYADALDREWSLPENATYRDEVLAALPYVQEVSSAIASIPEAVGPLSRSAEQCGKGEITGDEHLALRMAEADLRGMAAHLDALALSAPAGIDASRLRAAADRLADWQLEYRGLPACVSPAKPAEFLTLTLQPTSIWPTGTLRMHGATSSTGLVRLSAPALALDQDVEVREGRFVLLVEVPADAPLGPTNVTATLGALRAEGNATLGAAPATLEIEAPERALPGEELSVTVTLTSPALPARANVTIAGAFAREVELVDGRATLVLTAPAEAGSVDILATYAGSDIVSPAETRATLEIVTAIVLRDDAVERENAPLALALGIATLVVGLGATALYALRQRRARLAAAAAAPAPHAADVEGAPVALVESVARVHRRLRRDGVLSPGATVREGIPAMGEDAADVVAAFERVRYGGETESETWRERARRWFQDVWARLGRSGA